MTLTLDAATEKRIQREIDLGHYREPAEVVAHALALLEEHDEALAARIQSLERGFPSSGRTAEAAEQTPVDLKADRAAIEAAFGLWSDHAEDGLAYQLRMRDEW